MSACGNNAIYALIGNPVGHSLSPLMHNRAYGEMKLSAHYLAFCVEDVENALRGVRALHIKGVSVTIPHKVAVIDFLDEVDEKALKIGAVNTIVHEQGLLKGSNTDWLGIIRTLQGAMEIKGRTFAILGAGGTAQAAAFGIVEAGGLPIIVNRTENKGRSLAAVWGCPFHPLKEIDGLVADCLINTTSVGMYPHVGASPVPLKALRNFHWVMDVIYNPLRTRLLREAEEAGCTVLSGLDMFVHQGAEQIKLWTGIEPPRATMREVVMNHLQAGNEQIERGNKA